MIPTSITYEFGKACTGANHAQHFKIQRRVCSGLEVNMRPVLGSWWKITGAQMHVHDPFSKSVSALNCCPRSKSGRILVDQDASTTRGIRE
ncbi:hypothetical protein PAXRUDRAFT_200542 [Paxillus rubicundulus Ve08.2h10]|uniref:Uncharacterized protein n=1 Tax=Paxillus rubicundulus Ve08.2h10 TaxID=930991 RepID=A0A0D0EBI5_9AGAM|nr:hypothetical protein PAXRUDRAFT_200542 [Paxillus rubicundulus Ve08.2h10]